MADRVFLHVGTMKSATSYLQALANCNMEALAEQGVLWPWTQRNFLAISDLLGKPGDARPGVVGAWVKLKERMDAWEGDALMSNELLAARRLPGIKRLVEALAPSEIQVIITARDLARTLPSQRQTGLRNHRTHRFDDFVADLMQGADLPETKAFWNRQDLPAIVRRFSRAVPADQISLVTVPPSGTDFAVTGQRFLSVLGLTDDNLVQPVRSNSSLGAHSAELMRRLNSRLDHLDAQQYRWAFNNGLAKLVLNDRASREPPITLTPEQLSWTRERAIQMVDGLASSGVKVVGDLADLIPALPGDEGAADVEERAAAREAAQDVDDATMLELTMEALAGLGTLLGDLRIEHESLLDQLTANLPPKQQAAIISETRSTYHETRGAADEAYLLRTRLVRRHLP